MVIVQVKSLLKGAFSQPSYISLREFLLYSDVSRTNTSPKILDVTEKYNHFPTIIFESNERVYFMLRVKNIDENSGWRWELQHCRRANQEVVYNFLVTNIGQSDNNLQLSEKYSRIFVSGSEYKAVAASIGQSNSSYTNIIRGIPTKVNVTFNAPQEATKLEALEVYYLKGFDHVKVRFRDVNVNDSQASNPTNPGKCTCPPQTNPKKPRSR